MSVTRMFTPYSEYREVEDALLVALILFLLKPTDETLFQIKHLALEADTKSTGINSGRTKWARATPHILTAIDYIRSLKQAPPPHLGMWWEDFYFRTLNRVIPESMMRPVFEKEAGKNDLMEPHVARFLILNGVKRPSQ
jgi:hypothetical protein